MYVLVLICFVEELTHLVRLDEAEAAHEHWLSSFLEGVNNEDRALKAYKLYTEVPSLYIYCSVLIIIKYLKESSAEFGLMLTNYNMYQLYVGIFLTATISLALLLFTINSVNIKETSGILGNYQIFPVKIAF
jgi:hypothetical protein